MALSKIALRRLTKLVHHMAALPKSANEHFNMQKRFAHVGTDHTHPVGRFIEPQDLTSCGTTACALGFAATIPSFRRAGLVVEAVPHDGYCQGESNSDRAMKFFRVPLNRFESLFSSDNQDKTPKQWAKRVGKLLREWA